MQKALIFDCDGVLADTEPNGHLAAFNQMWATLGVPWSWSKEQYGEKLRIAGGKERMASLWNDPEFRRSYSVSDDEKVRKSIIADWHQAKTAIYETIVHSGQIPARPGVKRIATEAIQAGWRLAVASTSAPASVDAVLKHVMGDISNKFLNVSGDVVAAKKPAPDIYNLAVQELGVLPEDCIAIEDSRNGLLSAKAAHVTVVVTVSEYTPNEDFSEASLVVDSLGDPGEPNCTVLNNRTSRIIGSFVTLTDLESIISKSSPRV